MAIADELSGGRFVGVAACAIAALLTGRAVRAVGVMLDADEPAHPTYRLVPLAGEPLSLAVDDADGDLDDSGAWAAPKVASSCLPFLRPFTAHRDWALTIADRASSCTGDSLFGSTTVFADGRAWRTRYGLRDAPLTLTAAELQRLVALDALSCVRTERLGYGERYFLVAAGEVADGDGGARVSSNSALGAAIDEILNAAEARYRGDRLAQAGRVRLHVRVPAPEFHTADRAPFVVDIVDRHATFRHRGELVEHALTEEQLVDLLDWAESYGGADLEASTLGPDAHIVARGTLTTSRGAIAVALSDNLGWRDPVGWIVDAVRDQAFSDR